MKADLLLRGRERSSGYFGEPLGQVTTLRGPLLASRTGGEG